MRLKLNAKQQIEIPTSILKQLNIRPGSELSCKTDGTSILLTPVIDSPTNKLTPKFEKVLSPPLLEISFFGRFSLQQNGEEFCFKNKKVRELLALLIAEKGKHLRKSAVAECLWPNYKPGHATDNLYKVCHTLQNLDGLAVSLNNCRNELWLELNEISVDIFRFEALYEKNDIQSYHEAVSLYKGSFLLEESFDWTSRWSTFYEIRYLDLVHRLILHYESIGFHHLANSYKNLLLNL